MGKKALDKYTCDVLGCHNEFEMEPTAANTEPVNWTSVTLHKIRGHYNKHLWLCPEHYQVIDRWVYG